MFQSDSPIDCSHLSLRVGVVEFLEDGDRWHH